MVYFYAKVCMDTLAAKYTLDCLSHFLILVDALIEKTFRSLYAIKQLEPMVLMVMPCGM